MSEPSNKDDSTEPDGEVIYLTGVKHHALLKRYADHPALQQENQTELERLQLAAFIEWHAQEKRGERERDAAEAARLAAMTPLGRLWDRIFIFLRNRVYDIIEWLDPNKPDV